MNLHILRTDLGNGMKMPFTLKPLYGDTHSQTLCLLTLVTHLPELNLWPTAQSLQQELHHPGLPNSRRGETP